MYNGIRVGSRRNRKAGDDSVMVGRYGRVIQRTDKISKNFPLFRKAHEQKNANFWIGFTASKKMMIGLVLDGDFEQSVVAEEGGKGPRSGKVVTVDICISTYVN